MVVDAVVEITIETTSVVLQCRLYTASVKLTVFFVFTFFCVFMIVFLCFVFYYVSSVFVQSSFTAAIYQ